MLNEPFSVIFQHWHCVLTFVYFINLSSCTSFGLSNDIGDGKQVLSTWLHFVNCVNVSGCYWLLIPRCVKFACVKTNTLTSWPIIKGGFFQELTHKYSDVSYKQLQILLFPASKLFFSPDLLRALDEETVAYFRLLAWLI